MSAPTSVTADMARAAEAEWARHDARIRETEDGRWHWFCSCGDDRDENEPVDEDAASDEASVHAFGQVVAAALAAAPAVTLADVFSYEVGYSDGAGNTVLSTWDALLCVDCGNRYDAELWAGGQCPCGTRLQPVTVQVVTRSAT